MIGVLLIGYVWLREWLKDKEGMLSTARDLSRQAARNRGDITQEEYEASGVPADGRGTMWHYGNLKRAGMMGLWPHVRWFAAGTALWFLGFALQIYAQWPRS
ncbi:MAG: hypothetical protein WBX25_31685 [Rhodomicrobium sp.]